MWFAALLAFLLKAATLLGLGWFLGRALHRRLSASARFRMDLALIVALPFLAFSALVHWNANPGRQPVASRGLAGIVGLGAEPTRSGQLQDNL